ncbi:ornithine carbamoyltransferase [Flavobacterium sp. CF108]|jgi:ornithine carbamoyltransferase|uniref:ornithine carbamoyltransferase n=1 Tax=unclassified Flavobacterium TaxID=196869 RepID=UPI0008B4F431|nr:MULTISPECIES: ornithine carbamoyltransferase [unclassified Flavobacterium]SEO94692.1 ornithine carbamoyltransferase [Flavobacterium sp. fv08]SHH82548.1 ornithine carbamoyltransferase [Flavobacterium sp. CF108]
MSLTTVKENKHVISLVDLSVQETLDIVNRGIEYANGMVELGHQLQGKIVGIYFTKTSTRTRTSFSTAALRLGAQVISYGPNDLQINTGENLSDTLQVLSQMLDGLVVRTGESPALLRTFANQQRMSIVNAMTEDEHPTQALADLTTMKRYFGEIQGLEIIYLGEGNNTASALALAFAKFPNVKISFFTPPNYQIDPQILHYAQKEAVGRNTVIAEYHDLKFLPPNADVIYTTRWQTTGTVKLDVNWRDIFEPFAITQKLMSRYPNAIFMHDLPAHRGEEVEAEVIDGDRSIVFEQAENKAHSAKAVLEWCMQ